MLGDEKPPLFFSAQGDPCFPGEDKLRELLRADVSSKPHLRKHPLAKNLQPARLPHSRAADGAERDGNARETRQRWGGTATLVKA